MTEEKKNHRSGHCLRIEPESIGTLAKDKSVLEAFKKAGCLKFCEKLQGGHSQVTKEFALHFTGSNTKIGILNLSVTPEIIALLKKIPRGQETWFKGFRGILPVREGIIKYINIILNFRCTFLA